MERAILVLEFNSVAGGIFVTDLLVKEADVAVLDSRTVCPGKYVVTVSGGVQALDVARRLAARHEHAIEYVESDLYGALDVLAAESFDFVFTGIGALCWLPDIQRWAGVVAALLKPGGFLFIREGHPVLWSMSDPRADELLVMEFPYFENEGTVFTEATTYVEHAGELSAPTIVSFNHASRSCRFMATCAAMCLYSVGFK